MGVLLEELKSKLWGEKGRKRLKFHLTKNIQNIYTHTSILPSINPVIIRGLVG